MKTIEIADSAGMLGRLLSTGEPLSSATEEMSRMQPAYAEFWAAASAANQNGRPLSESIALVWPETLVSMVHAGEQAGRLPAVLLNIRETCDLQLRLKKIVGKLYMPLAIFGMSLVIGLFFMAYLTPKVVRSIAGTDPRRMPTDPLTNFAFFLESLWKEYPIALVLGATALILAVVRWIRSPDGADSITRAALSMPILGPSLRDVAFGLWAKYLAVTIGAGIPLIEGLKLTATVLPRPLREGVAAMHHALAVQNLSIDKAVADTLAEDDPRREWPRYITNAFRVGERTGQLDAEFNSVSPALLDLGERSLTRFIETVAMPITIACAAASAITPLILIYQPVLRIIRSIH